MSPSDSNMDLLFVFFLIGACVFCAIGVVGFILGPAHVATIDNDVVMDRETYGNYSITWCEDEYGNMINCSDPACKFIVVRFPSTVGLNETMEGIHAR